MTFLAWQVLGRMRRSAVAAEMFADVALTGDLPVEG